MAEMLLQTKLHMPPLRPSLISCPYLIKKLNIGQNSRLALISAPAGFGKTTLVTHWLSQVERPSVWVSLDEDDNDLVRFFTYVAAAVQQIEGVGRTSQSVLRATQPAPPKSLATVLINDCLTAAVPFILVLDDYHVITERAVHEAFSFLLDNLPPQLHLVITSRTDPLLPLPRLRARGQMTELRTDDLRFTAQEAADFLQQAMGLTLSVEQVSALEARTEGWIAGLQMAALSLQGLSREEDITAFVTDFTGSHRYIFDYLTDEVLQQRPSDTQSFLLQTSVLDQFNASLCTAVTGQKNSQALLETLESANLFLFPLDDNREWYRYHHLFADLLRQRLQRRQPKKIPQLYQRASQWYAERGDVETAVHYALAGDDVAAATGLLDEFASDFIKGSEVMKLHKLLARLPAAASDGYPRLNLAQGWVAMFLYQFDQAENYVSKAEACLPLPAETDSDFPEALVRAQVATVRAYSANRQGQLTDALAYSNEALAWLNKLPDEMAGQYRGTVLINLGQIQTALDEVAQAKMTYRQAMADNEASGRFFGVMASYSGMMNLQNRCGQLAEAKTTGQQGLARLMQWQTEHPRINYPAEGELRWEIGVVFYEKNELSDVQEHMQRGADVCRYSTPSRLARCLHYLFLVALARNEVDTAVQIQQQIESALNDLSPIPWLDAAFRSERLVCLSRCQAAVTHWREELRQWIATLDSMYTTPYMLHQRLVNLIVARVLAVLDQPEAALDILNQLAEAAEAASRLGDLIHYRVQQAAILQSLSQAETAVTYLNQAVTLAEKEGYLRVFLDEADALQPLLPQLPASPYRDRLINLMSQEKQTAVPAMTVDQSQLVEALSDRELEVLSMLTTHLSGPEIAGKLHISLNTFKTHTKNIYSKLGVKRRNTAVTHAKELGLL